jgi:hypothetical protein
VLNNQHTFFFENPSGNIISRMGRGIPFFLESTMHIEQLLCLVQKAHTEGTQYLRLPNHFINVDEVIKWKASYEQKLYEATKRLE